MRVLVTGSDGYVGAHMVPALIERGHDAVGLDTGFYAEEYLYEDDAVPVTQIRKDIRRVSEKDLLGFEAVVHLAELSNDPLGELNPEITHKINHRGSVRLAMMCKRAGVRRFVYSSSCSVYGLGITDLRSETDRPNPQTAYAVCKVLVERDVATIAGDGFSPTFLRNATAYGPSPRMRFDLVLNNLAGLAWTLGEIRMISDGTPWRPLVHVRDICEAVGCVLEAPRSVVHNEIFNVGDSLENYQIKDIAQIVSDAFPGCKVTLGPSGGDNRSYRVSFDKIANTLTGFHCQQTAMTGAHQLRTVFEQIGLSRWDFEYRAWTRIKQLQYLIDNGLVDEELYWIPPHR